MVPESGYVNLISILCSCSILNRASPSALKVNGKFEILFVKIFSLKQQLNQIPRSTTKKIKFRLVKKIAQSSFRV